MARTVISMTIMAIMACSSVAVLPSPCTAYGERLRLPHAVQFEMKELKRNSERGLYLLECTVQALICRTALKIDLQPSRGVTIVKAPQRLKGWVEPGTARSFRIICHLDDNAQHPALSARLRYRLPIEGMREYVMNDSAQRYRDPDDKMDALEFLDEIEASGKLIQRIFRRISFSR